MTLETFHSEPMDQKVPAQIKGSTLPFIHDIRSFFELTLIWF